MKAIVKRAAKETGASYACLLVCDQATSELRNVASYGRGKAWEDLVPIARWVLSRAEPLVLPGAADAQKVVGCSLNNDVIPLICVPLKSDATPRGVLIVGSLHGAGEVSPREAEELSRWLPFLEALGELAAVLLENAALQGGLLHKEEQVRDLIRDTLSAQEAERERICLEVHDGVAQTLVSIFQCLQILEASVPEGSPARQLLSGAITLVKQAIRESREIINSLQPAILESIGLVATLRQEMRQLAQETGLVVDFRADPIRFPTDIEMGLYRIIHEAVTNIRKHASADRLRVTITCAGDQVKVEVRDWGIGFDYNPQDTSRRRGTGLLSMRKRAELLQGVCDIQSTPGEGTAVRVEVPLSGERMGKLREASPGGGGGRGYP
ncbi:MAG: GAF domain-containing sensor histidine kinase [Chloroflexi bacterium]|nr:GAF domain-containing sensor histidine kinase [Chloroflexota bacterium]MCL5075495.1 GAF domain-containing sensor histidine kinase [Chloroflexota bacterium]